MADTAGLPLPDTSGHDATRRDHLHTMTLKELEARIFAAGIVMSRRQIMRHCKALTFDAKKLPAMNNIEEWFIAPDSVEKGIADIRTLQALRSRHDATRRDVSSTDEPRGSLPIDTDTSGHDATRRAVSEKQTSQEGSETEPVMSRYVEQLEKRIEEKDDVIGLLKGQLVAKDEQIGELSTRYRETHSLLGAMQRMLAPLLGQADPYNPPEKREGGSPLL